MHPFHPYIKAVGTGMKHNRDLSAQEMQEAMEMILKREASNEQIAAFLLGWRLKPESTEEFKGALSAFDSSIQHTLVPNSIELGYPYDGKVDNPYLFPLIAKEVLDFDINLIISTDALQPSKQGTTTKEIATQIQTEKNIHFMDRAKYFPALSKLTEIRTRLGLRTGFNAIERLVNPAKSDYAIIGVFHKPFVQKYIDTYHDRYKRLIILKGAEGAPEILGKCSYWLVEGDKVTQHHININDFGIYHDKSYKRISQEDSVHMIQHPSKEHLALAKLNAALYLHLMEKADSLEEGFSMLD
jgi:anthranilate phosphoribosyltransferase